MQNIFGSILGREDRYWDTGLFGGNLRIFEVGDLVRSVFPDHSDLYPNGSPRFKKMIGIVTGVYIEEGYETYRVSILIRGEERWAHNFSLHLVEAA